MYPVLTADQMAQLDRYTIDHLGLDGKILMSSAARETLRFIMEMYPGVRSPLIFAGTGNNGGDGVALAYYALQAGLSPELVLCHPEISDPPKLSPDSLYYYNIAQRAYVSTQLLDNPALAPELLISGRNDLIVDALFGTGLNRPLSDYYAKLVERINHAGRPLVAVDCPSGLNCTTGEASGAVVRADHTVTMGLAKQGFFHPRAGQFLGGMHIARLGFAPPSEAAIDVQAHAWPDAFFEPLRHARAPETHKGDYGRVLVVAGHRSYPGAPRLAAAAAVRSGAGLVRLVVPEDVYPLCGDHPAVMVDAHPTDGLGGFAATPDPRLLEYLHWADALVIGPGFSSAEPGLELARQLLAERDLPVVVDADALRVFPIETTGRDWPLVLTPHVGELARLTAIEPARALAEWFSVIRDYATRNDTFVLAKSNQCAIGMPTGEIVFPSPGHPALASGGTGDVLSGVLGALLARCHVLARGRESHLAENKAQRQLAVTEVIATAVNIHAQAARSGVEWLDEESFHAADLVDQIPAALRTLREQAIAANGRH